jgi:hypothetical protein
VKQLLLALITVFIFCCPAFGQTIYTASRTTTYAWDQPDQVENGVMGWKIILVRNVTGEQFVFLSNVAQITIAPNALDSTAKRLKSGDYEVRVSALNVDGESGHCSSADLGCSRLKTGEAGAWRILYKPGVPLGPIIIGKGGEGYGVYRTEEDGVGGGERPGCRWLPSYVGDPSCGAG